jgi:hypothetical protein
MSSTFDDSQSLVANHSGIDTNAGSMETQSKWPIQFFKRYRGAIANICVSDPTTGAILGRLKLERSVDIRTALKVDRDVLLYSPEHVESLTVAEL